MNPSVPGELAVEVTLQGGVATVALAGELDIATAPRLERKVDDLPGDVVERVVLDLRGLSFIDSTGLRVILGIADSTDGARVPVVIVRGPDPVQRVFVLTGADRELAMIDDPAEIDGRGAGASA